jgi:hypothetical protein
MKVETIRNLQDSLESLKKHTNFDMEKLRKECLELRDSLREREG